MIPISGAPMVCCGACLINHRKQGLHLEEHATAS